MLAHRWLGCLALLLGCVGASSAVNAGDWPQILGPNRNGVAVGETFLPTWPADGPQIAWKAEVGAGYAGVAISDGKVVVFDRALDKERVLAFDLATGRKLWQTDFDASYRGGIDADLGPRCVPTIADGRIYVFGAGADLHAVDLTTGKSLWSRNLASDYAAPDGYFGAGSSPIVAGGKLWVNLGGKESGLIALALDSGKTLYSGTKEQASYSSPTLAKIAGKERLIFVTRYNAVGIDPNSGDQIFSFPFGMRGPTVNAATPLVFDDRLFVTASYGIGAKLASLRGDKPTIVWENDTSLSSQYTTAVYRAGYLYGVDGREDAGGASLRCLEAATGKVMWSEADYGVAHVILAGDKFVVIGNDGQAELVAAAPTAFKSLAKATLSRGKFRALPALSEGRLLVRTVATGGKSEVICAVVGSEE